MEHRLGQACERAFEKYNFPLAAILNIKVRRSWSRRFYKPDRQRYYVVTVKTSNPPMLRGDALPYKGSYKERVEAVIQKYLDRTDSGATVHVEVVGSGGALDGFISIQELVRSGKASADSPLVRTASRYGIQNALLHGRHLIGPSPAVAALVRHIVTTTPVSRALDLFAGTGIASKVICTHGSPMSVVAVERDSAKVGILRGHAAGLPISFAERDAFSFPIDSEYDLVIADPYYEDVLRFLNSQGPRILASARRFLLATGSVEDVGWNRLVRAELSKLGFSSIRRHSRFGQVIFDCVTAQPPRDDQRTP